MNPRYRMLSLLRDEGPLSRAELGDRLELPRPPVLARVELPDLRRQLGGERRNPGLLVGRHRHHDVVGLEAQVARRDEVAVAPPRQAGDANPSPDRQPEAYRVGLEVGRHLVFGGESVSGSGEGHAIEAVQTASSEEPE